MIREEFHETLNTICENGYALEAWEFFNSLRENIISANEKMLREAQATLRGERMTREEFTKTNADIKDWRKRMSEMNRLKKGVIK